MKHKKKAKSKIISFAPPQEENVEKADLYIRKSVQQEADEVEEALNRDLFLSQIVAPDDMFQEIVAKLREQGVWET